MHKPCWTSLSRRRPPRQPPQNATFSPALTEHGIDAGTAEDAQVRVATAVANAARDYDLMKARNREAAALRRDIERASEGEQVAQMLGRMLSARRFEAWLCGEALDSLVIEASETLMSLSGGQYELDRTDSNDFVVVDYHDAGARRPVQTLSGGETFQASLALALALAKQVVSLSGGHRELDSIFLDEGFGTLDETTLDMVASTLEGLTEDGGRMVGVITHVPALADRVPVKFRVTRDGTGSHLRKERA
jgi:exonuclease SbcC